MIQAFIQELNRYYPDTGAALNRSGTDDLPHASLSEFLISPHIVELPTEIKIQAQAIVNSFYILRDSTHYIKTVCEKGIFPEEMNPGNYAALMSFDFHINDKNQLKLIEINTNASLALMADLLYRFHKLANPFEIDFRSRIVETFQCEAGLIHRPQSLNAIAIVDQQPEKQKLYVEFLMYQELFRQIGIRAWIGDTCELVLEHGKAVLSGEPVNLIYNRDVDFYLQDESSEFLKSIFTTNAACVSPNPFEYQMLADKNRLADLSRPDFLNKALPIPSDEIHRKRIGQAILTTKPVSEFQAEQLWAERKSWFFKPARAFGGKAVYRGQSITKSAFESVLKGDFVVQEYCPAPVLRTQTANGDTDFKYDLRFIVYHGEIQIAFARLYQGQVTNSQTAEGGIAAIQFTSGPVKK